MSMNCADLEPRLNALLDGEVSAGERPALEAHLAGCEDCRRSLESLRAQHIDLDAAFGPDRVRSEALAGRIVAALPRRWNFWPAVAAAAAVLLAAVLLFRPEDPRVARLERELAEARRALQAKSPATGRPETAATLVLAIGKIESRDGEEGAWEPLREGADLEAGAWIRTAARSKGSFTCSDGSELRLNENTEVRLEQPRRILLGRGEIFTCVFADPAPFEVRAEQTKIEALGTSLNIAHRPAAKAGEAKTVLKVLEGSARMAGQVVASGYLCQVVDGKVLPPTRVAELTVLTNWVHELLVLKGKDTRELHARVNELLALIGRTKMEQLVESEIRSLGEHCALPLTRYIQSPESGKDPHRRRDAARILADVASSPSVPDFVALLRDPDSQVRVQAGRGLHRLTGQTLGFDDKHWTGAGCVEAGGGAEAWSRWLEKNSSTWKAPREKP